MHDAAHHHQITITGVHMTFPLSEIAERLGLVRTGTDDPVIKGAAGFDDAGEGQISFVDDAAFLGRLAECRAAALIIRPDVEWTGAALRSNEPRAAFAKLLAMFAPDLERIMPRGVHVSAIVDPSAKLGESISIGPGCVVGPETVIGDGCRLGAHVVLEADVTLGRDCCLYHGVTVRERCQLGDRVTLHSGVVIGTDGFGYHPDPSGLVKIPQIGIVELEDDVEIGANSCVDRATTGRTRIGAGTKIDNLCQVGHNVDFGSHSAMSALSGISGSCTIGVGVTIGGQSGMADHRVLGDGVKVAAKTAVIKDVPAGQAVIGFPAVEFRRGMKLMAHYQRLPELAQRVGVLESRLDKESGTEED